MRTIKKLEAFYPEKQIKLFFREMSFGEVFYLGVLFGWTFLVAVFKRISYSQL